MQLRPSLLVESSIEGDGYHFSLPQLGIVAVGETDETAGLEVMAAARAFAHDYLRSSDLYFFELENTSYLLPYALAIQEADACGQLGDYLLGADLD